MPAVVERAQSIYIRTVPGLERKVCPGVRRVLQRLERRGAVIGLGDRESYPHRLEKNGARRAAAVFPLWRFRGTGARIAPDWCGSPSGARARKDGSAARSSISLIGDHPNDVRAAKANGIRAVAVATGLVPMEELRTHSPDVLLPDLRSLALEMLF